MAAVMMMTATILARAAGTAFETRRAAGASTATIGTATAAAIVAATVSSTVASATAIRALKTCTRIAAADARGTARKFFAGFDRASDAGSASFAGKKDCIVFDRGRRGAGGETRLNIFVAVFGLPGRFEGSGLFGQGVGVSAFVSSIGLGFGKFGSSGLARLVGFGGVLGFVVGVISGIVVGLGLFGSGFLVLFFDIRGVSFGGFDIGRSMFVGISVIIFFEIVAADERVASGFALDDFLFGFDEIDRKGCGFVFSERSFGVCGFRLG